MSTIEVRNDDGLFRYSTDANGKQFWVCIEGRVPGMGPGSHHNLAVPLMYGNTLRSQAIENGADFSSFKKKPKSVKTSKARKSRKSRKKASKRSGKILLDFSMM